MESEEVVESRTMVIFVFAESVDVSRSGGGMGGDFAVAELLS